MKDVLTVKTTDHQFIDADFIGGHPVLDFINTVTGRDEHPQDWLDNYEKLVIWAKKVDLLPLDTLADLSEKIADNNFEAEQALLQLKELREELFSLFYSLMSKQALSAELMEQLEKKWHASYSIHRLVKINDKMSVAVNSSAVDIQLIEKRIIYLAVELACQFPTNRLRICKGSNCSWLFLDSSKAGRRCWCDMKTCGNTSKARRFTEKKKLSNTSV